jgi:hypothetical protein
MDMLSLHRGRDPLVVARTVLEIIRSDSPRLRYPVGPDSVVIVHAKRFLPFRWIESFLSWMYLKGGPLGVRRILIDGQLADPAARVLYVGPLALAFLWLRRRLRRGR